MKIELKGREPQVVCNLQDGDVFSLEDEQVYVKERYSNAEHYATRLCDGYRLMLAEDRQVTDVNKFKVVRDE